ncbi:MAG: endonuclease/exonuclease/phosphatase family protein [Bacteroidetes bacterium]|nr:endonuclease/exonuclease/phosphatase family protein [Bacteroidota bacterium]
MARPFYFFLLTLLCVSEAHAQEGKARYQVSAVAFYNMENLFDTLHDAHKYDEEFTPGGENHYTSKVYHEKLHNLATVIRQLGTELTPDGAALIGAAEIENDRVLRDLVSQPEIKDRNYRFVHFESPDSRGIDVALLYNPKYFLVLQAEALYTDISGFGQKGGKTRDVLHVIGVLAGDTTHVFVNHWPSRRGGEAASAPLRAIAARVSKRVIDSLMAINPETRVLLMGDLNDDPNSPSVARVLGAKGNRKKVKPGELFNPWDAFLDKGIGTLAYRDSWNLFDQIMLSSGWLQPKAGHWRFYRAEIFSRDFLKEQFGPYKGYPHRSFDGNQWINGYSDHFPVIVYLVKPLP